MEIKYIRSAGKVLNRNCVNKGDLDLSKDVLWVSVGQRAAELLAVKVGGVKKKSAARPASNPSNPRRAEWPNFFQTSNFDSL